MFLQNQFRVATCSNSGLSAVAGNSLALAAAVWGSINRTGGHQSHGINCNRDGQLLSMPGKQSEDSHTLSMFLRVSSMAVR